MENIIMDLCVIYPVPEPDPEEPKRDDEDALTHEY